MDVNGDGEVTEADCALWGSLFEQACAGEQVALRPASADGLLDVSFRSHVIGRIELRTRAVAESP